jgi:hypothetical protein
MSGAMRAAVWTCCVMSENDCDGRCCQLSAISFQQLANFSSAVADS